jgi:chemotaxis protein methyltransferase CheR
MRCAELDDGMLCTRQAYSPGVCSEVWARVGAVRRTPLVTAVPPEKTPATEDLADPALVNIRDLLYRVSGIYQTESKFHLLATRCRRRMQALNSASFADYFAHLALSTDVDGEIRLLLNEITVGETYFFRSAPQINALIKVVLPQVVARKPVTAGKKIRLWSAGCSTGEEPYTMAIVSRHHLSPQHQGWNLEVSATDLNDKSLLKCRSGVYDDYAVRKTDPDIREKYFVAEGPVFRVSDELRSLVSFTRLNLEDQAAVQAMQGFDIIFCCNVLIYFDDASKQRAVSHFFRALLPGGHFFLGDCESLYRVPNEFRLVHYADLTAYRKPMPGEVPGGVR